MIILIELSDLSCLKLPCSGHKINNKYIKAIKQSETLGDFEDKLISQFCCHAKGLFAKMGY